MSIDFPCRNCGSTIRCGDEAAGRKAKCPHCGGVSVVPGSPPPPPEQQPPADPFDGIDTPSSQSGASVGGTGAPPASDSNPFQSPSAGTQSAGGSGGFPPEQLHQQALEKVKVPAIILIGLSVANIVLIGFSVLINLDPINMFISFIIVALNAVIIAGAVQMMNLRNYGFAMAACIISMIPCFALCCFIHIPFGIWGLVVLSDVNTKEAFDKGPQPGGGNQRFGSGM